MELKKEDPRVLRLQSLKNEWPWSLSMKDIIEITDDIARRVYGFDETPCKLGSHPPSCFDNVKCTKFIFRRAHRKTRLIENPVGLKNPFHLCYLNSMMQLLFRNSRVRRSVYDWPQEDVLSWDKAMELKLLFAELELSRDTVDPEPFAKSLGIDIREEKDCHEFYSCLGQNFESLYFDEVLRGEYGVSTVTPMMCPKCTGIKCLKDSSNDICLNVPDFDSTLENLLLTSLERVIDFEVQCNYCGNKFTPGLCKVKHTSLPKSVMVHLHRSNYDSGTGTLRKVHSYIDIPDKLTLEEYADEASIDAAVVKDYTLTALLMHLGPSSEGGHYVLNLKVNDVWCLFNDNEVFRNKLMLVDKPSRKCNLNNAGPFTSNIAYIAVYESDDHKNELENVQMPENLQKMLQMKGGLANAMEEEQKAFEAAQRRKVALELLKNNVPNEFFPTQLLAHWAQSDDLNNEIVVKEFTKILCPHNKLHPLKVLETRMISNKLADLVLSSPVPVTRLPMEKAVCKDCILSICLQIKKLDTLKEDQRAVKAELKGLKAHHGERTRSWLKDWFWISKELLPKWVTMAVDYMFTNNLDMIGERETKRRKMNDPNTDVRCKHGRQKAGSVRLISEGAWKTIFSHLPYLLEMPQHSYQICSECSDEEQLKDDHVINMKTAISNEQKAIELASAIKWLIEIPAESHDKDMCPTNLTGTMFYLVASGFVKEIRSYLSTQTVVPPETLINMPLMCKHEMVKVDIKCLPEEMVANNASPGPYFILNADEWNILKSLYTYDYEICIKTKQKSVEPGICCECFLASQSINKQVPFTGKISVNYVKDGDYNKGVSTLFEKFWTSIALYVNLTTTIGQIKDQLAMRLQPYAKKPRLRATDLRICNSEGKDLVDELTVAECYLTPDSAYFYLMDRVYTSKDGYNTDNSSSASDLEQ